MTEKELIQLISDQTIYVAKTAVIIGFMTDVHPSISEEITQVVGDNGYVETVGNTIIIHAKN